MPDKPYDSEQLSSSGERMTDAECDAICIDVDRIYDSCGAKDCLSDLPLMFTKEEQELVENACSVRINRANVITSTVEVEPVAFHRGFYSVDVVFYFSVSVDVYLSSGAIPTTVNGLAVYGKRVVLYGSDGSIKSYSSDKPVKCNKKENECSCNYIGCMPMATVQISNPMALSAKLVPCKHYCPMPCEAIPQCVREYFCGELVHPCKKQLTATIGIFTITRLQRRVQIMIPSYDFCVPRKECKTKTDDPCEVFSKIEFPTDTFFPPKSEECERNDNPFECDCEE